MGGDTKRKSETEMENAEEKKKRKSETEMENAEEEKKKIQELRDDLFREAAKYVSDFPSSKIDIFSFPPSGQVSLHSFGYSSVEPVRQPNSLEEDEDDANDDDEEEEIEVDETSLNRFCWEDIGKPYDYDSMSLEELEDILRVVDKRLLHVRALKAQVSRNQEDGKVGPKP